MGVVPVPRLSGRLKTATKPVLVGVNEITWNVGTFTTCVTNADRPPAKLLSPP